MNHTIQALKRQNNPFFWILVLGFILFATLHNPTIVEYVCEENKGECNETE